MNERQARPGLASSDAATPASREARSPRRCTVRRARRPAWGPQTSTTWTFVPHPPEWTPAESESADLVPGWAVSAARERASVSGGQRCFWQGGLSGPRRSFGPACAGARGGGPSPGRDSNGREAPALGKASVSGAELTKSVGGGDRVTVIAELTKRLVLGSLMRETGPG